MGTDSTRRTPAQVGFTLVELLVVISILALLVSLLLPDLSKARKQAVALQCGSHLHALAHAQQMYASEYNGWIPRELRTRTKVFPFAFGLSTLLGYDLNEEKNLDTQFLHIPELQCPAFPKNNHDSLGRRLPEQPLDYVVNNFPKNYRPVPGYDDPLDRPDPRAMWRNDGAHDEPPQNLNDIRNISGVIYLTEAHRNLPTADPFGFHDVWRGSHLPRGRHPRSANDMRHPSGINAAFFDAHIERRVLHRITETDWYFPLDGQVFNTN